MSELVVPAYDPAASWPTLGPQVVAWIEANLVHGPGDINGQPAVVSDEMRGLLYRLYEVQPRGTPRAGRRRFHRASISLPKGCAKTELGAWIVCAELAEDAPVRCDGWDAAGEPVGVGIVEPYIPLLACTEDQSEGLCYAAVRAILLEGPLADDFETGKLFITRRDGRGRCEAVAAAPLGVDGGKTTFNLFDEEQGLKMQRHRDAHKTMLLNATKLQLADPWSLGLGTAPVPGEGSVAETSWEFAELIAAGKHDDGSFFFFGRWGAEQHDLATREDVEAAVVEAYGPAAAWSNTHAQVDAYYDPSTDRAMWEGRILNRRVQAARQVFPMAAVIESCEPLGGRVPPRRTPIALGFDGSRTQDATGLVGTVIETGYMFVIAVWERPLEGEEGWDDWEVPYKEVEEAIEDAMERWKVVMAFFDPPYWEGLVDACHGRWPDIVIKFHTNQHKKMALTLKSFVGAIKAGEVTFDGHPDLLRHMANARKRELNIPDDDAEGGKLYVAVKERKGSPLKIDLAVAATLSWQARLQAIGGGALTMYGSKPGRTTVSI
jgi:hypothetical protein